MNNLEFLWICLTLQHRNRYYCMQVEGQEKLLLHVKSLKSWPGKMEFVIARVQLGQALHLLQGPTFHSVFKTWTPRLNAGTSIDEIFKSLGGNQLKMVVVDEVSMLSAQFLVLLDTRLTSMYKPDQIFGGISILLIGDFIQLPVTLGRDLWSVMYGTISGNDGTARNLFQQFPVKELTVNMQ
jgi:hypothetical protein